jgi:hypothetical protein
VKRNFHAPFWSSGRRSDPPIDCNGTRPIIQGLANQLIAPEPDLGSHSGQVRRRERLGGLLRYYYRDAA